MFYKKELALLRSPYFKLIKQTASYIEIQSCCTDHLWIIQKSNHKIIINHKHSIKNSYYHKHGTAITIAEAIKQIKKHDSYVLGP